MGSTYTPFGKALKTLQIDYGFRTVDVARAWGASTSFVYAVMSGRKPAPGKFITTVCEKLNISKDDKSYLEAALDMTPGPVTLHTTNPLQAEVANTLARTMAELSQEDLQRLRSMLGRSGVGEAPARLRRSASANAA